MTLFAVALGVAVLILIGGFVQDIFIQLRDATIHSRIGFLQVYRTGYYEHGRRDPDAYWIEHPDQLIEKLTNVPHVVDIMKRVGFAALLNNGRADQPIVGEGVEPGKEAQLGTYLSIIQGRQLTDRDEYGILLGEGVAKALELEPGDYSTVLTNTALGTMNSLEFQVVGIFRTYSKDFDARAVRVRLQAAHELLDTRSVHGLVFSLDRAESTNLVAEQVRNRLTSVYDVKTWVQLDDFYPKTVNLYRRQFAVLNVIVLGIVLLGVANAVTMSIYERVGEFGTLMALGDRGRDIFKLIMVENALLGLFGALSGVVLGCALASGISAIGIPMPPPPNANSGYTAYIRIVPSVVATAFIIGLAATVLAALLPARSASRTHVAEALRQNA